ncbi:MAG TPA: serine/threonine-protein kinase [Gemmatimonas sp.]|nr:serine/threonine-protein kinase [Gemmatimonas sp.]
MVPEPRVPSYTATTTPPRHLDEWVLPPGWTWGAEGLFGEHRHYQEVIDALGRSLSLVSAPSAEHGGWLQNEARALAHRNHPSIPTTYHYWASYSESRRGPGYLRRWISGETVRSRVMRLGTEDVPTVLQVLREAGSALAYLHDTGAPHGAVSASTVWLTPGGRLWLLGWEWMLPREQVPTGLSPERAFSPPAPEWGARGWKPTAASDQWQLAAMLFMMLTGETPPEHDVPPIVLLRPDCPHALAALLERALDPDPARRFPSIATLLRDLDRYVSVRVHLIAPEGDEVKATQETAEIRLRRATADDYEILSPLGRGMFGSVWRARDLSLAREVAIKVLHRHISKDDVAVARFRREAVLAAGLAHPSIVPIYDSDSRGDVVWYTMELAEGGSVASLVSRSGPRPFEEIAPQVNDVLEALIAAHSSGIIHRDLKPENILIDRYRRWRIGDFGIAYALGDERAGTSGTPSFAAPEQLLGEAQGPATDCYAMASIVYFVLTGHAPFGEGNAETVLARQLSENMPDGMQQEGFTVELQDWIRKGLSARVEDRFDDAAAMRAEWRQVVRSMRRAEDQRPWWRRLLEGPSEVLDTSERRVPSSDW